MKTILGPGARSVDVDSLSYPLLTIEQQVAGLPVLEQEFTQLGSGNASFESAQALGRDAAVVDLHLAPFGTGHVIADPEWCVLFAPLRWRGDFVFNGQEAEPGDLFLTGGRNGWATTGRDRDTLCIGLRRARLREACEALSGGPLATGELPERRLSLVAPIGERLRRHAVARLPERGELNWRTTLPGIAQADLISACASLLIEQGVWTEFRDPGRIDPLTVVRVAKQAIDARYPQPMSMAELCAAAGVGKSWLHKCFVDIHGVSPMAFLRARRLTAAYEWFVAGTERPQSVKEITFGLGFINGGRFSADYNKMFGEMPSETLARNSAV